MVSVDSGELCMVHLAIGEKSPGVSLGFVGQMNINLHKLVDEHLISAGKFQPFNQVCLCRIIQ